MSNQYNQAYFNRFRQQNSIQKLLLNRIDRKEPLFSQLIKYSKSSPSTPTLLDLGCGTGLFLSHAVKYFDSTGVDISKEAVKQAKKLVPTAKIIKGDFGSLKSFPTNHFDVITLFDVLEHIDRHQQKLHQVYRILKPEGLLAFSAPNAGSLGLRLKGTSAYTFRDSTHLWHYSTSQWQHLFAQNGFIPYRTWHGGLIDPPYVSRIPKMIQTLVLKYPSQLASLYGLPVPSIFGEVVFMLLLKNPQPSSKAN